MNEHTANDQPEITEEHPAPVAPFGVLEAREPAPALPAATPAAQASLPSASTTAAPSPTPRPAPTPAGLRRPSPRPAPSNPAPRRTDPARFGRIDAEGVVWLRTAAGEIVVGQWAAGTVDEGLAFFGRKYDDVLVEVDLAVHRLQEGRGFDTAKTAVDHARTALATPTFVGDVDELVRTCEQVELLLEQAQAQRDEARRQQREEALLAREALVIEAESLAQSTQWKSTGERFAVLLESWKTAPRVDRSREQALWKRFSAARTTFDRHRRQHFASRDAERRDAVAVKEALIAEAEALSSSSDWGDTTRSYRTLMDRWKAAGHAGRQDEDRLWARFRAAQDAFFAKRDAANAERDGEHRENLDKKLALIAEAEALVPVSDLEAAKRSLRSIQDRWESIGHVPRNDKERIEKRLRAVEEAVRNADQRRWTATDPQRLARAEDTAEKFRASLAKAEKALAAAQATGDARAVAKAQATVDSTRALLVAVEGTLTEFGS